MPKLAARFTVLYCSVVCDCDCDYRHGMHIKTLLQSCNTVCACKTVKGKGIGHPRTGHEDPDGEYRYSSTLSLTLTLDVGGQHHAPAALLPGKTRFPLYRRLGGPQGRSARVRKISPLPRFDHGPSSL